MATISYQVLKDSCSSFLKDELSMRVLEYGERKAFEWRICIKILRECKKIKKCFRPFANLEAYQISLASKDTEQS